MRLPVATVRAAARLVVVLFAAAALACGDGDRPAVLVFAASSLRDVLTEIAPSCRDESGVGLAFHFAGSSTLARQIEASAAADVFFSADEDWMDELDRAGLVDTASRRAPVSNRLVVVVPLAGGVSPASADDLAGAAVARIALADPDSVPAGKYAMAWLRATGTWEAVRDRVVPVLDVRAALAAVESGAVDAGVVYATDAAASRRARVAFSVPEGEGPPIAYAVAPLRTSRNLDRARRAVDCMTGPVALAAFERHGFALRQAAP